MAEIRPFRGWYYNTEVVGPLDGVVAPPYDVISPLQAEELYRLSPYNIVRLVLGRTRDSDSETDNRYARARALLDKWREEGALIRHPQPNLYAYEFVYKLNGNTRTMRGLVGLVRLSPFAEGQVLPHEQTFSGPKIDRLNLMRACSANLDQVYSTFRDGSGTIAAILAEASAEFFESADDDDGTAHRLAAIGDAPSIDKIRSVLSDKTLFIADGHHRYETALNYAAERRAADGSRPGSQPYDYIPMLVVDTANEDVTVLATHRVIKMPASWQPEEFLSAMSRCFRLSEEPDLASTMSTMAQHEADHCFGVYAAGRYHSALLADGECLKSELPGASETWKKLDTAILENLIVSQILDLDDGHDKSERIAYTENEREAVGAVDSGDASLCLFLNPTKISQIEDVAASGEKMPHKSTYFFPKPLTGLIINTFD